MEQVLVPGTAGEPSFCRSSLCQSRETQVVPVKVPGWMEYDQTISNKMFSIENPKMEDDGYKQRWKYCVSASSFSFFFFFPDVLFNTRNCCFSGIFAVIRVGSCNRWQSNWVKWNINSGTQSGRCTGHVELQSINITEADRKPALPGGSAALKGH